MAQEKDRLDEAARQAAFDAEAAAITPAYRRYALIMLVVVYTSSHVDRNILSILVEDIRMDLGLSDTALGFLSGFAFAVFYATLGIPVAWLADRGNRRNIIAWSIAIWSALTAACGLAQNFWHLALARIGVGVGEAGSSPPSHSMISDLYPQSERSSAMAIYALGVYFGVMIGYFVGGWVSEWYGWRVVFFLVGLPGIAIALVVRYTMIEPPRGLSEGRPPVVGDDPPVWESFRYLLSHPAMIHLIIGCTLTSFVGYGTIQWNPAFLIRTLDMSPGEVGSYLAPISGIVGGLGAFTGGMLADRLAAWDPRWNAWLITVTKLATVPLAMGFYLSPDPWTGLLFLIPTSFLGAFYLGPTFAMIQTLTPPRLRAMAAAVLLLILNLIGLGLGPQLVGIASDLLRPEYGDDSLRYALTGAVVINVWAAFHYFIGGFRYKTALEAQTPPEGGSTPAR